MKIPLTFVPYETFEEKEARVATDEEEEIQPEEEEMEVEKEEESETSLESIEFPSYPLSKDILKNHRIMLKIKKC